MILFFIIYYLIKNPMTYEHFFYDLKRRKQLENSKRNNIIYTHTHTHTQT